MEKNLGGSRLEDDPSSLTSFNFIPEGDEEGLISKIFSKFKTAVSSGSTQQYTSPSSSTRTISIVLSNESGMITDQVVPEQHLAEQQQQLTKTPSNTSSSATDTIVPVVAATTTTPYHHASTSTGGNSNKTDTNTSMASSPLHIHTHKSNTTAASANINANNASASTLSRTTTKEEDDREATPTPHLKKTTAASNATASTHTITAKTPTPASLPKQQHSKHIIIDEEQNQQQRIPSHMIIPLTKTSSIDSDTQSVMTTFSVSNTNSLSRILNRLRGGEPVDSNKDFWMPDEQCKECNNCNAPFNLFRRKHHCRTCGRIFCSKCLSNSIHTSHSLRVCNDCYSKFMEGYRADDTISLHDGYSYSSVVVDGSLSSSLQPQQQQLQKSSFLIPTSGDDDSSDEELEFDRSTNSFDMQRPLDIHFSQSTSSHHTASDSDIGFKKLLTNTFLRTTPRSRTSTMNSLGIDTSLATLEGVRQQQQQQQQINSPMPFRRNSFLVTPVHHDAGNSNHLTYLQQQQLQQHMLIQHHHQHQQQGDCYDGSNGNGNNSNGGGEDDDLRRNPRNLLNFWGTGERPSSGIFNNFSYEDYHIDSPVPKPILSTSTSTVNKTSSWLMRPSNDHRSNSIMRRRLSLTETNSNGLTGNISSGSSSNGGGNGGSGNNSNLNSGSSTSSTRHIRVRTKSLMRNTPITMSSTDHHSDNSSTGGYESPASNSNRNSFYQPLTPSTSTPTTHTATITTNTKSTATTNNAPDLDQLRAQILSVSASTSHPVTVATHRQWDPSFIYLMRNIITHLLKEGGLPLEDWEQVMMEQLLVIADQVQPHIRIRDTFNLNHYVKIKKVPGGLPKDSFSVSGVVLSKSVAHKHMMRKIKNPSILILNFDVDGFGGGGSSSGGGTSNNAPYNNASSSAASITGFPDTNTPRQEYLKFDRLLAWEKEHMNSLVSEIIGLKPHIVLIASHAPRTIIERLNQANIVVAYNIKKQKLDAIARCADATVFNYKNELWNAKTIVPGKCGLFEPLTVMHEYLPNRRKTFLMFHECPKERGATIVLRGGSLKTLATVKYIMNFMVKVANNINLEAQLRKDFIELRRYNQPTMYEDYCNNHAAAAIGFDEGGIMDMGGDDDDSSTLHQHPIRSTTGGRSTTVSSYHQEGSSSEPVTMDTQSVSALSVAESQITVNTVDINAAKKKSQQQYQQATVIVEDDDICLTAINLVLKKYQTTTLSISPGVTLPVPHILLKLRESQKKLIGLIRERLGIHITGNVLADNSSAAASPTSPLPTAAADPEKQALSNNNNNNNNKPVIPPIPTDLMLMHDYLKAFDAYLDHDLEYRHYQDLHLQCWLLFKRYIGDIHLYLTPVHHQQIIVRRTTNPMDNHSFPCEKAMLDPYDYYNPMGDCTLGQYILNSIKDAYTKCSSKMCGGLMIFHDRTYSHGNAQIKVQVFLEDDSGGEDELVEEKIDISRDEYLRRIPILICTHCNFCNVTHNWKPMSDLLQRYSFGKFLELLFYQSESIPLYGHGDHAMPDGSGYFGEEEDGHDSGLGCPHGFYRDHTISFRYQNLSVNFTHAMVQVVEVNPPPLHLRFSSKQQMALKDASLDSTRSKIAKFFDSIIERNKAFSYDIVQPNMVDLCKEYLQELSQEALKNKKNLLQKLQMEYATSAPTDTLQLNNVLADLQNHAVTWDLKYIDFARRFVRPERELRRLTTNHLRKMFPAESLYNSSSNTPVVSNLNLRTKRAIEAADLPLLDVGLDQEACMVPYGVSGSVTSSSVEDNEAVNLSFKDQPGLGESPTESYPWHDELKRFDQMFMQDDPTSQHDMAAGNSYSSTQMNSSNKEGQQQRQKLNKKYSVDSYQDLSIRSKQPSSPQKMSSVDDLEEDTRDLDPSVARRLSLELMKDAPKKKKEAEDKILKEQQQKLQQQKDEEKRKNYLEASRILESSQTADTPPSATTPPSTPMTESFSMVAKPLIQDSSQSRLIRQAAALPILSSTAYKRLAGLLPDPMVGKSKSSPSPGNYLPIQQQKATPIQRLLDKSAQKNKNRKSQFYESSSNHFMENSAQQMGALPQQQDAFPYPNAQPTTAAADGPTPQKPAFYRGSPYTAKMPERSSIAYRYGFMSGLNNNKMPMAERRLGAANITHPVSSALAAAQAAQRATATAATTTAAASASASTSKSKASSSFTSASSSTDTTITTTTKEAQMQDISIARPRSRTMAIVGGSSNNLLQQPSSSRLRVGGRIPVPTSATHLLQYPGANSVNATLGITANSNSKGSSNHKFAYNNNSNISHLPVPIASPHHPNSQYTRHHRKLSDGKISTRTMRQRLPSKASLEPYTKIKEMTEDDGDDDDMDIDRSSVSSSSSSSSSSAASFDDDDLGDGSTVSLMDESACQEGILVVKPTSNDDEQDEQDMDDELVPFQHNTFSLTSTDEYDESLGREIVPSIIELEQFHNEHQLQLSTNTLPFLSLECGMVVDKKQEGLELKGSTAMMEAAVLLKSSSVGLDWSTNTSGRNSIMKAITYVLAEKSISNLTPLEYPFSPNEHIFADSNILVREDEPSSIISYMLGSTFYNEKLQRKQELRMSKAEIFNTNNKEKSADATTESKPFFSEMFPETDEREKPWRFSFQGGSTSFSCKIYFAEQFDMLRKSCGCDEIFISSLARCTPWDTAGGKSGSIFLKTNDQRFLIKQISKYEMDAFLGSANKYFLYMFNEVFDKGIPTVLCKIFGLYRIGFYNNVSGKSMKMDILVMENLFYDTSVKKVFDLKGSMRNRYAEKTGKDVEVFLDENLVEVISKNPLYMRVDTKCNLSDSLYNDTQFLLSLDVMDYSLLVGFDEDTNEIIVGIVDFIRTFTWDKKLESWVKESGMLGGGKKDPTIVSPRMYRKRFRSAIDLYFCMIPDFWTHILD
ncbi:uncharacterized protein ATC70_005882 [Mucor velutinosus]|uniref:1-phosphatidylinositol-3-phosphate 5-kinase n=1 Tax=Mucor velutinosus TaxID=708070 RepID=A0AAN7HZ96_9FUNG|nr:hypothetical protein ATC70_005882 [Mucor velutinosus]